MVRPNGAPQPDELQILNDIRGAVPGFVPNPYLSLGETDSAHGVLFGQTPQLGEIAVKPFGKFTRARQEANNLRTIQEYGFLALEPIEIAQGGLRAYLLTARMPGLNHLGQLSWGADIASKRLRGVIEPTLMSVAEVAADWHNHGITNGDMQPKNMAFDAQGRSVYVDAEKAQFREPPKERTAAANRDLNLFGVSALAKGLLDDKSPTYRAGYLANKLLDPYFERLNPDGFSATAEERRHGVQKNWVRMINQGRPRWVSSPPRRK